MEFLNKMKKRDTLELVLKTIAVFIVTIMAILLMEAMIHGIYIKKIKDNVSGTTIPSQQTIYCEEIEDGQYQIYVHDPENETWHLLTGTRSKQWVETAGFKEVHFRQPNAFDVSITWVHYVVIGLVLVAVLAFYGYRFYILYKDYQKFEARLRKTGKLFN